jgi:hypothetical protein
MLHHPANKRCHALAMSTVVMSKARCANVVQSTPFANGSANSAEDYCSAVAAAVVVVANQVVAVLVAAGAVSSTAVHSGLAAGRIAALQRPVLRYSPAAAAEIPKA